MDRVFTPAHLAERYDGISESTLAQWRLKKKGPAWFRNGKYVFYTESAIVAYEKAQEAPQVAERELA